jgi:signal transduction histidine kinase
LELLDLQGQLKGVELEKRMTGALPRVHADPTHLQQLLVNLMLNACDALEGVEHAIIRIEVAETTYEESGRGPARRRASDPKGVDYSHLRRLEALNEGTQKPVVAPGTPMARITIADNGPGIAEDEEGRVFEPFYTTKEPGRGTGLGLAVSARLVEAMRGDIYVERGIGQGAAFTVLLPVSTNRKAP